MDARAESDALTKDLHALRIFVSFATQTTSCHVAEELKKNKKNENVAIFALLFEEHAARSAPAIFQI